MKPDTFGDRKVYLILLLAAVAAFVVVKLLACGPGESAATRAARTAAMVMRALCHDQMTVGECGELLEERARYLDANGGASSPDGP